MGARDEQLELSSMNDISNYRVENHIILIDKLTDFFCEYFDDFPIHNQEILLSLVVAIDTNSVEKFFEENVDIKLRKEPNFINYEFVKLMRLYSELCANLLKKELDICDILADEIYLLSHLYLPKIIDEELLQEFKEWNFNTYGPGERLTGTIKHIKKELKEIEKEPHDIVEWVDVIMLAVNGALRHGHEPQAIIDAFYKKFEINKARKWKDWRTVPEGEPITHIKE